MKKKERTIGIAGRALVALALCASLMLPATLAAPQALAGAGDGGGGSEGTSGTATGPKVHFEVWLDDSDSMWMDGSPKQGWGEDSIDYFKKLMKQEVVDYVEDVHAHPGDYSDWEVEVLQGYDVGKFAWTSGKFERYTNTAAGAIENAKADIGTGEKKARVVGVGFWAFLNSGSGWTLDDGTPTWTISSKSGGEAEPETCLTGKAGASRLGRDNAYASNAADGSNGKSALVGSGWDDDFPGTATNWRKHVYDTTISDAVASAGGREKKWTCIVAAVGGNQPEPTVGMLELRKASANAAITKGNPCYSLAGAEYGVYGSKADADADEGRVGTLTTDASGKTNTLKKLEKGTYYVKETKAPKGYALDKTAHKVTVSAGETATVEVADVPLDDPNRVRVTKRDGDRNKPVAQAGASIAGAEYTFRFYAGYYDESNLPSSPTKTWVMKTGADGTAKPMDGNAGKVSGSSFYTDENGRVVIPLGTITAVETKAPEGYRLGYIDSNGTFHNPKLYISQVVEDAASADGVKVKPVNYSDGERLENYNSPIADDAPVRGNIKGVKADSATPNGKAQGAATLAGAKIAVINKNAGAVVSPEDGTTEVGYGGTACTLTTDANGAFDTTDAKANGWTIPASFGRCALPYGTYELREAAPPAGYNPNTTWSQTVTIGTQGQSVATGLADDAIRGDLDLFKFAGDSQRPIAGVPFVITSKTTGESHVLVTDANGYLSTASAYKVHSANTNANDAAVSKRSGGNGEDGRFTVDETALVKGAGVWFSGRSDSGGAPVDDELGAMPYDTYVIDEVRCAANEEYDLITGLERTVETHGWKIGPVTIFDDHAKPEIGTTLTDEEKTHSAPADGKALLTDTVRYAEFEAGTYTFKGRLHLLAEDGSDKGVVATATKQVNLSMPSGEVEVGFVVDASEYAATGCRLVATEEAYDANGKLVAEHDDFADEAQTVRIPAIETTLTDLADGDHEIASAGTPQTVTDHIVYRGLTPSKQYTATLALHKRNADGTDGGALLDIEGNPVTATQKFFPSAADGAVDVSVTFTPDSGGYAAVAFEEVKHRDAVYAVHADISDESQTVWVPKIATIATDRATGIHVARLDSPLALSDNVAYTGLEPGTTYTFNGTAHLRDASGADKGALEDASGKPVTATAKLAPKTPDGTVMLNFEADASAGPGNAIVIFEEVVRDETGAVVAEHKDIADEDQTVHAPSIATTAFEKSKQTHYARSTSPFTIADTVEYKGLEPGIEYTAHGEAHAAAADGTDAGALKDGDGNAFETTATFTPERAEGSIVVEVEVDPQFVTDKIVMFEDVSANNNGENVAVADHKDISDEDQTVYIPSITTEAHDKESGTHSGTSGASATAVDEVSFTGLEKGAAYTIKGALMDKTTGQPFLNDGREVTAELPFVARKSNGMEEVEFNIDRTLLGEADLVMFERIYDASGDLVALHEDINSAEQSVSYRPPSPLDQLEKLEKLEKLGKPFDKTGYGLARYWWVLAVLGVGLLLVGTIRHMGSAKSIFNDEDD